METRKDTNEIKSNVMRDNDTWNTCPHCGANWKDAIPTPGILHRTKICHKCLMRILK